MASTDILHQTLPDGTVRQWHPLTGLEVLGVPGRGARPLESPGPAGALPLQTPAGLEDFCDFCPGSALLSTPEKARLAEDGRGGPPSTLAREPLSRQAATRPLFRRFANLFPILSLEFWKKNHGHVLGRDERAWMEAYLAQGAGAAHVRDRLEYWWKRGVGGALPVEWRPLAEEFFGGGHDLVVSGRHYREGARFTHEMQSSGSMTPGEHEAYLRFTAEAALDLRRAFPEAGSVAVFQNWKAGAGASLEHLHKQVLCLEGWGPSLERAAGLLKDEPGLYNRLVPKFSGDAGLALAENAEALAVVMPGQVHPTVGLFSKAPGGRLEDLSPAQWRGLSDLVQATHAALGPGEPSNEEWVARPPGFPLPLPLHLFVRWRSHLTGGLESGTGVYVNPHTPAAFRERMAGRLKALRAEGRVASCRVAEECGCEPDCLRYAVR